MDNGLVQLALVFLGLAATALLIVVGSDSRFWRGIARKVIRPAPPLVEPTRSKPATHTTQPLRPTHKPSPFIDDLAEQIQYFDALLPQVATAIDALPHTLDDYLRLRADVDEIRCAGC